MNFSDIIQKKKKILLPLSWLYQAGVFAFQKLYSAGIKKTYRPPLPVICVGNLSVGGTGKSPMVEYLLRQLAHRFRVATVSRGYKRNTRGFLIAGNHTSAAEIGDEPMQLHTKHPQVLVTVSESRVVAIEKILAEHDNIDVVILDDAFQHRAVAAGLNILLTEYTNLFTDDYYLPAGSLRDLKSSYKRAEIIVVTKCPENLSAAAKQKILQKIKPLPGQHVFFTAINYGGPYHIFNHTTIDINNINNAIVITAIANATPLIQYLKNNNIHLRHMVFNDHHQFTAADIADLQKQYETLQGSNKTIITTEKDAMRLQQFKNDIGALPIYAIPVAHKFLFDEGMVFDEMMINYIDKHQTNKQ